METNEILKFLRQQRHLTQQELAIKLDINLSSYQKYERKNNTIKPSIDALIKIADFYDVTVDYLLGREQKKESEATISSALSLSDDEAEVIAKYMSIPAEARVVLENVLLKLVDVSRSQTHQKETEESPLIYCGTIGEELERRKREEEAIRKDTA